MMMVVVVAVFEHRFPLFSLLGAVVADDDDAVAGD